MVLPERSALNFSATSIMNPCLVIYRRMYLTKASRIQNSWYCSTARGCQLWWSKPLYTLKRRCCEDNQRQPWVDQRRTWSIIGRHEGVDSDATSKFVASSIRRNKGLIPGWNHLTRLSRPQNEGLGADRHFPIETAIGTGRGTRQLPSA